MGSKRSPSPPPKTAGEGTNTGERISFAIREKTARTSSDRAVRYCRCLGHQPLSPRDPPPLFPPLSDLLDPDEERELELRSLPDDFWPPDAFLSSRLLSEDWFLLVGMSLLRSEIAIWGNARPRPTNMRLGSWRSLVG